MDKLRPRTPAERYRRRDHRARQRAGPNRGPAPPRCIPG